MVEARRFAKCDIVENPTNLSPTGIKGLIKLEQAAGGNDLMVRAEIISGLPANS